MGKETEAFSKRFNAALREVRGVVVDTTERNPIHGEANSWIKQELARTQGVGGQNPPRDEG